MRERPAVPEIPLLLAPQSPDAHSAVGFRLAGGDIGSRSKLGGEPSWLQDPDVPACSCGEPMTFYGQLDSIGDDLVLADCGLIYVFVCFGCFETKSVLQSN